MSTYKTYEVYKARCENEKGEREEKLRKAKELVRQLELDIAAVNGQIVTLETLMNVEDNPPIVELPFSGERDIKDMFADRLKGPKDADWQTIKRGRQGGAYLTEAIDSVEFLDEANREAEASEDNQA